MSWRSLRWVRRAGAHDERYFRLARLARRRSTAGDDVNAQARGGASPKPALSAIGDRFALGAAGPQGTAFAGELGPIRIALHGHPFWNREGSGTASPEAFCERFVRAYRTTGVRDLDSVRGDFAIALIDTDASDAHFAIDRIGIRNLVYCADCDMLVFGPDSDVLADPGCEAEIGSPRESTISCTFTWCPDRRLSSADIRVFWRAIICWQAAAQISIAISHLVLI